MALPSLPPISTSQIKAEFNKGNNLRNYLGAAPGVPTSGTLKQTDFLGKSAAVYHYGYINGFTHTTLPGYYRNAFWWNDAGANYSEDSLDKTYGSAFGGVQDWAQTSMALVIEEVGADSEAVYNGFNTLILATKDSTQGLLEVDAGLKSKGVWSYDDLILPLGLKFQDNSDVYYNATYDWVRNAEYSGGQEGWMRMG